MTPIIRILVLDNRLRVTIFPTLNSFLKFSGPGSSLTSISIATIPSRRRHPESERLQFLFHALFATNSGESCIYISPGVSRASSSSEAYNNGVSIRRSVEPLLQRSTKPRHAASAIIGHLRKRRRFSSAASTTDKSGIPKAAADNHQVHRGNVETARNG